jgi:hypothetical protein
MKKMIYLFALLALAMAACGPAATEPATATDLPPTPTQFVPPTDTPAPDGDLTPAQRAAIDHLAATLGIPADQVELVSAEAVEWPDSCLGILVHGVACAEAITPGFNILLEAGGLQYEIHTNEDGTALHGADLGLYWGRFGGIAGFCDELWVFRTGEAYAVSCDNGGAFPVSRLTGAEAAQLATWVQTYGTVALATKDPAVADAMELKLDLNGLGSGQPDEAAQGALFTWAQVVYEGARR